MMIVTTQTARRLGKVNRSVSDQWVSDTVRFVVPSASPSCFCPLVTTWLQKPCLMYELTQHPSEEGCLELPQKPSAVSCREKNRSGAHPTLLTVKAFFFFLRWTEVLGQAMRLPQCPQCVRKADGMADGWNCLGKQRCLIQSLYQDEGSATPRPALPWWSTVNSSKSKQGSLLSILPTGCTPTSAALQEADTQPPAASQGWRVGKRHFSSMSPAWTSAGCSTLPRTASLRDPGIQKGFRKSPGKCVRGCETSSWEMWGLLHAGVIEAERWVSVLNDG